MSRVVVFGVLALALSACVDGTKFVSDPVVLKTSQGEVTCQLYTKRQLQWDEAVEWPEDMHEGLAREYCRAEGIRRQDL